MNRFKCIQVVRFSCHEPLESIRNPVALFTWGDVNSENRVMNRFVNQFARIIERTHSLRHAREVAGSNPALVHDVACFFFFFTRCFGSNCRLCRILRNLGELASHMTPCFFF